MTDPARAAAPAAAPASVTVRPVASKADKKAFVELPIALNAGDPNWVPPLKDEVRGLITPGKNPWFEHAEAAVLPRRARRRESVGRISAQVDQLVLEHMGAGLGQWGMFEAEDEEAATALLAAAEGWLRGKGMTRSMGPFSLGIWDEPGLLVKGHDHPPMVMMGHNNAALSGLGRGRRLCRRQGSATPTTCRSTCRFPPIVQRIVASGEKNPRIRIRKVDKSRFDEEAALILAILNEAWSDNWGFIPLTDSRDRLCRQEAEADRDRGHDPASPNMMGSRSPS